jgi:hypothetical protein
MQIGKLLEYLLKIILRYKKTIIFWEIFDTSFSSGVTLIILSFAMMIKIQTVVGFKKQRSVIIRIAPL